MGDIPVHSNSRKIDFEKSKHPELTLSMSF